MRNPDVFENAYIVKLFHNPVLQARYLPSLLPEVFRDPKKKVLAYIMRRLHEGNIGIDINSVVLFYNSNDESLKEFLKTYNTPHMEEDEITDILFNVEAKDGSDKLFDFAVQQTKSEAFKRYLDEKISEMQYYNKYDNFGKIAEKARKILSWHDILFNPVNTANRDQLKETREYINNDNEYLRTFSQALNTKIGGWTIGHPATVIARSSHCKSTWITYNTIHSLLAGKIERADIIAVEEKAEAIWRRAYAILCNKTTSGFRQKTCKVTEEDEAIVRKYLGGKLHVHDGESKYSKILEIMQSLETPYIVLDHLQSIAYPGNGTFITNMIGGIPGLVNFEERLAKKKNLIIINLSQVNDKEIEKSNRPNKAPKMHDAYASSALQHASREFLSLYYPFKDYEENEFAYDIPPSISEFHVSVEKSSFTGTGKIYQNYDPERAIFTDAEKSQKKLVKATFVAGKEKEVEQLTMQI